MRAGCWLLSAVRGLGVRATPPKGEGTSLMWRERVVRFSFAAREYPHGAGLPKIVGNIQTWLGGKEDFFKNYNNNKIRIKQQNASLWKRYTPAHE